MKRKLIDIDLETERRLSILASKNGMSLKRYIEYILFSHGQDYIIQINKEVKKKTDATKNQMNLFEKSNEN